jgi:FdhD protein
MKEPTVEKVRIKKVNVAGIADADDVVAVEEPLEIRLAYKAGGVMHQKSISVTMRTPGDDVELATGFLFTEGIISAASDVVSAKHINEQKEHVVQVVLDDRITPDISRLERNFYTTSSCGVCGKASIEAVFAACTIIDTKDSLRVSPQLLISLPGILRARQDIFEHTGGLHGCALFDMSGLLILSREDVGRHNALDKLVGAALRQGMVPLNAHILLLSGRASFELMQKAAMAGVKIVAAVGAPSSLAVRMAEEWGITLIGFLRDQRFNIYSGAERIL